MKKCYTTFLSLLMLPLSLLAQGWPAQYEGVMLQGFSWDSYVDTQWANLERQADELSRYFSLIWVPQSGNCNSSYNQMGYTPVYYFDQNSSFGTEAQLRSMIAAYRQRGTGIMADVVVNHRNNLGQGGSWTDYPAETYGGQTYQMLPTDICANDDQGKTRAWASSQGIALSSNNDTGEDWDGCRDLDHKSQNVQTIVKAYLQFLLHDLGYAGFRYDMTKGFGRNYLADYNASVGAQFSVGEYWDGNSTTLKKVVDEMKKDGVVQSATFDFAFRYSARDACNQGNWSRLTAGGLATQAGYDRYAITFVENHDTQDRGNVTGYTKDPINSNIEAANAWLLAMPGTPCVFLLHWKQYKSAIKQMILARRAAGINNQSAWLPLISQGSVFAVATTGTKAKLVAVLGPGSYTPDASEYVQIMKGTNYAYYLGRQANQPWASLAEGTYDRGQQCVLTAVTTDADARLVYTLDGTDPTAQSTAVASGTAIAIDHSCTLKVALLTTAGEVTAVAERQYTIEPFVAHQATVYLKDPQWGTPVYFYAWANDGKNTQLLGGWPGTAIGQTTTIDGTKYYYRSFDVATADYSFNVIFNQGSGKMQTVDIGPISSDRYYEIAATVGGKFTVSELQVASAIDATQRQQTQAEAPIYNLQGQRLGAKPRKGIFLQGGKKRVR